MTPSRSSTPPFLLGPYTQMPNLWARHAYKRTKSGAVLAVGLYCWALGSRRHRRDRLLLVQRKVQWETGVGRTAFYHALNLLQKKRLLQVLRRPRHGCLITLPSDTEMENWDAAPEDQVRAIVPDAGLSSPGSRK